MTGRTRKPARPPAQREQPWNAPRYTANHAATGTAVTDFWLLLFEEDLLELTRGDVPCYVREQAAAMLRFANGEPDRESPRRKE